MSINLIGQKDILTTRELAKILNVHINTIRKWADRGIIPYRKVGKRNDRLFDKNDIQTFLDGCQYE
jgi:excisionase family DNA binding protein